MRLKYIDNDSPGNQGGRDYGSRWFRRGECYEVAEIHERPGFLMVRPVGEAAWPRPGDSWFDIDPYAFETPLEPIPIRSCGYVLHNLGDYYGCIIDDGRAIDAIAVSEARFSDIDDVQAGESVDAWASRMRLDHDPRLAAFWYGHMQRAFVAPDIRVVDSIVAGTTPARFAVVAYPVTELVRRETSLVDAARLIREYGEIFGVGLEPKLLDDEYWTGTGEPRIINERAE
ncbi:MAG: hypothetical protein SF069_05310 [Phycisphaerae bacterium]|nr:hypothetical protein [Phycisphaerae bacterium]